MSSPHSAAPNAQFQERLARVVSRRAPQDPGRSKVVVVSDWRENISGPAGLVSAVLIGILSVLAVRLGRYHLMGVALVGGPPDTQMAVEFAASLFLSFIVFLLLPWKGFQYKLLQFGGVAVMMTTMHNFVHSSPGLFSLAFSTEWSEQVIAETEPSSLWIRGQTLPFTGRPAGKEEVAEVAPAKPVVRKAGSGGGFTSAPAPAGAASTETGQDMPRRIQLGQ